MKAEPLPVIDPEQKALEDAKRRAAAQRRLAAVDRRYKAYAAGAKS